MLKKILVAPLNWGLGHATRCIPVIKALEKNNFKPIIASDGVALELLKKEFPHLSTIQLPSYNVTYAENGKHFKVKLISQIPNIIKAIKEEKKLTKSLIEKYQIDGIISDNRLGVHSKKIPSVFITHQLNVLTGNTTWLSTKLHHHFVKKFTECWVPDNERSPNLSGNLGHLELPFENVRYIGPLSRLYKKAIPKKYDLMIILSGPEPQRTLLEDKIISELKDYPNKTLFVRGIVENEQIIKEEKNITYYNFMNSEQIEIGYNESDKILTRSGYTTVMDLSQLGKKAFFIPTPGQYEQEYLAKKFKKEGIAPSCTQENFEISMLTKIDLYRGFNNYTESVSWKKLFSLF